MRTNVLEVQEKAIEYKITGERREFDRVKITNSRQAYNYALNFWRGDIGVYESTFVLLVDRGNNSLGYAKISQGGISGTVVDIRIILKYAIENLATGIFLFHNHPSGNLRPSPQDTNITKKLREAGRWMDIFVLDHIIVTEENYFSFADEGII